MMGSVLLAVSLLACSPEASTASGERGTGTDEPTPEPTVDIGELAPADPGIVIAPTPTPEGPRPLVVVTLMGESGVMAPLDGPALAGVVAEIDRLNEAGGVLGRGIELRRFDTNSRASLSQRLASRLADNPPDLIITSCDTEFSEPVLEIADEAGIITVSPCADDPRYLTGALGERNFTLGAPAEPRGEVAAKVAIERFGTTAIVLRDVTSPEALASATGSSERSENLAARSPIEMSSAMTRSSRCKTGSPSVAAIVRSSRSAAMCLGNRRGSFNHSHLANSRFSGPDRCRQQRR